MKELVIISENNNFIRDTETYIKSKKNPDILLTAIVTDNYGRLAVCYNDDFDIFRVIDVPLKRYFKNYKKDYFKRCVEDTDIVNRFINLNINREYNICFSQVKNAKRIYVDSVLEFLTKELKYSWNKIIDVISDNAYISLDKKTEIITFPNMAKCDKPNNDT